MSENLVLYPYLTTQGVSGKCWVFDDERTQIKEEPFVLGMSEMISRLVESKKLNNPEKGFKLIFSEKEMESDTVLEWTRSDNKDAKPGVPGSSEKGNWYKATISGLRMEGWLCPALSCFFRAAPEKIYIRAVNLPEGINPIWNPGKNQQGRRFVNGEELKNRTTSL